MAAETSARANIKWYRCPVDKETMSRLKQRSDLKGLFQAGGHVLLLVATGTTAYMAYQRHIWWLMAIALMCHASFYGFMGLGGAGHELCHKTVFKSNFLNDFFLKLSSFMGYFNYPLFIASHVKHHQYTLHNEYDLEVVLPSKLDPKAWLYATINPMGVVNTFKGMLRLARGQFQGEWENRLINSDKGKLKKDVMTWARFMLVGHIVLALTFVLTGHWFFLLLVTFGPFYCQWLNLALGFPQHVGLVSNVPDFRLSCRTYITNPFFSFLYWKMNYHTEHHMFPGVPCHNLSKLRKAIESDMPPAQVGLWATWHEINTILKKQKEDPTYVYVQAIPAKGEGETGDVSTPEEMLVEQQG